MTFGQRRFVVGSAALRHFLVAAVALAGWLLGAAAPAAAQQNCRVIPGWWDTDLKPFFIDPNGPSPQGCGFELWAWSAFAHFMQRDLKNGGVPLFLDLPVYTDLEQNKPPLLGRELLAEIHPRKLLLEPRDNQPQSLGSFQQAGPKGVLVDQNGRSVYYVTHMDLGYFNFTQTYFGPKNYRRASPTLNYPIGATVLKTAWRIVQPGEDTSHVFTTKGIIDLLDNETDQHGNPTGKLKLKIPQQTAEVTVALVGVHVVSVIKDHPEFVWATFEHIDNAPDLPPGLDPQSPDAVSANNYTFYKGGTPADASNKLPKMTIDPATQAITPVTNVFQQFQYGGATPASEVANIVAVNGEFQAQIPSKTNKIDPVFANYKLIGSTWLLPNSLAPGDGQMAANALGSIDLDNTTMETFVQKVGNNCFTCHDTTGSPTDGYAPKNINTSHIVTSVFKTNPKILQAR